MTTVRAYHDIDYDRYTFEIDDAQGAMTRLTLARIGPGFAVWPFVTQLGLSADTTRALRLAITAVQRYIEERQHHDTTAHHGR